jgi:GTP-binding protein HflX
MRSVKIPGFDRAILSDTVGFVSNLPTELVAAFRATLEEVAASDLILHVRDIAHPDSDAQAADVEAVLSSLGLAEEDSPPRIEVWNKLDLLPPADKQELLGEAERRGDVARRLCLDRGRGRRPPRNHLTPASLRLANPPGPAQCR